MQRGALLLDMNGLTSLMDFKWIDLRGVAYLTLLYAWLGLGFI